MTSGYYSQRLVDPNGASAFSVPGRGTYEFLKSAQGLSSSPAAFQQLMEYIFRGLEGVYIYLDDVLLASKNYEDNLTSLRHTLERLRKYNLKINLRKAGFGKCEVSYLGWVISAENVKPGYRKTQAILDHKPPTSIRGVRQWIGLTSFFRRCIPQYSTIAAPLTRLMRKDSNYSSGKLPPDALKSFFTLQKQLSSQPTLTTVNFDKPFIVTSDSSNIAFGTILSQVGDDGIERPCGYGSALMNAATAKKSAYDREKEGIRWALKHWRPYLLGGLPPVIRTDHKPLLAINNNKFDIMDNVTADIRNYLPFKVEYIPGSKIPADVLSRPVNNIRTGTQPRTGPSPTESRPSFIPFNSDTSKLRHNISTLTLLEAQQQDMKTKTLACYLKYGLLPKDQLHLSYLHSHKRNFKLSIDGLVVDKQDRVFVPSSLKEIMMIKLHDQLGHFGWEKTLSTISEHFYWDNMRQEVQNYVKSCIVCNQCKPPHAYTHLPLQTFPPVTAFNHRIHMDCITNLRVSPTTGNRCILVISDSYSGYIMAKPIKSPSAEEISRVFLNDWASAHSFPAEVVVDSGKEFQNEAFRKICDFYQIKLITTSPGISRQNGAVERKNRQLVEHLRKYINGYSYNYNDWEQLLPSFAITSNITRGAFGFSPHFLTYCNNPHIPGLSFNMDKVRHSEAPWANRCKIFAKIKDQVSTWRRQRFLQNKKQFDKQYPTANYKIGDLVYLRINSAHSPKLHRRYVGPFIILQHQGRSQVLIRNLRASATPFLVHIERLKHGTWRDPIFLDPVQDEPHSPCHPNVGPAHGTKTDDLPFVFDNDDHDEEDEPGIDSSSDDSSGGLHSASSSDEDSSTHQSDSPGDRSPSPPGFLPDPPHAPPDPGPARPAPGPSGLPQRGAAAAGAAQPPFGPPGLTPRGEAAAAALRSTRDTVSKGLSHLLPGVANPNKIGKPPRGRGRGRGK
jgi:transposase InsO family protein